VNSELEPVRGSPTAVLGEQNDCPAVSVTLGAIEQLSLAIPKLVP